MPGGRLGQYDFLLQGRWGLRHDNSADHRRRRRGRRITWICHDHGRGCYRGGGRGGHRFGWIRRRWRGNHVRFGLGNASAENAQGGETREYRQKRTDQSSVIRRGHREGIINFIPGAYADRRAGDMGPYPTKPINPGSRSIRNGLPASPGYTRDGAHNAKDERTPPHEPPQNIQPGKPGRFLDEQSNRDSGETEQRRQLPPKY